MESRIILPEKQLIDSCRILFGPDIQIVPQFLGYLQQSGVKAAYRKLAMETHPDRACCNGVSEAVLEERFKEVHNAYEQVFSYVQEPNRYILTIPREPRPVRPPPQPSFTRRPHFHEGEIPARRVFIGQFLYYSGAISRQQMWGAVVWQKIKRPRLGDIAARLNWLTPVDIQNILLQRQQGERFGDSALRAEMLSSYQLLVLLGRQRLLQPRIGSYFIERNILSPETLDAAEEALREHNRRNWFNKGPLSATPTFSTPKKKSGGRKGT
jgi:hypothetical protein